MENPPRSNGKSRLERSTPRPATLKRINMRRFLDELRRRGPSTRAELTREIGVAPPTSSNIIADLLASGFLEESDGQASGKGRPGKVFRLATSSACVLGATIDIDECVIAPAGLDGIPRKAEGARFPTPRSYDQLLEVIAHRAGELQATTNGRCLGLGLAVPGLVDERSGRVALSPNLHFMDGRTLGPDLVSKLGIPVACTQEMHALCVSEQSIRTAEGLADVAIVDIGSGLGMGVVSGGLYVSGRDGFAGEIGHITVEPNGLRCGCGNRGCLETVATDVSFLAAVRARLGSPLSFDEVAARLGQGDAEVAAELDRTTSYIAIGLATVVNLFNPEAIFVHGRLFDLPGDVLSETVRKMRERALAPSSASVQVFKAKGDKLQGALGGLLDQLFATVGPQLS